MADDEQPYPTTILGRMIASGLSEERARAHLARGVVRCAGEYVTDPDHELPWPKRFVIAGE